MADPAINICTGLGVTLPVLQPIAGTTDALLTGLLAPVANDLNALSSNINVSLQNALSGKTLNVGVLNPATGTLVSTAAQCNITANSYAVSNNQGISLGGGTITGLGGTANTLATAGDLSAIALGNGATTGTGVVNAIAFGPNASATATGGIALGAGASTTAANSVALGTGSVASTGAVNGYTAFGLAGTQSSAGEVSVGSGGALRQITNLAPGRNDTDGVNVAQLRGSSATLGTSVTNIFGGNATYNSTTNTIDAPNYVIGGNTYTTVGGAITAITNVVGAAPVQYSTGGAPTTPNPGVISNDVTFIGLNNNPVVLHNVGGGNLGPTSTDAVNGGQLYAVNQNLVTVLGGNTTYNAANNTFVGPNYTIRGNTYTTIGGAFTAIDNSLSNLSIPYLSADANAGTTAAVSSGAGSTTLGYNASSTGGMSTVVGHHATDNGNANATVLGSGASVTAGLPGANVALGQGSLASTGAQSGYLAFGLRTTQSSAGEVSVGAAGATRQVTNLAAGAADTDAVNVAQLRGTASTLGTSIANNFGGGVTYNATTATLTSPTYRIRGNTYNNVGSALTAVDNSLNAANIPYLSADANAGTTAAISTGAGSTTLGYGAAATGAGSTVIGNGALDNGVANATVIGNGASVAAGLSGSNVALGRGSLASTGGLTGYGAFGLAAPQNSAGEVSVGSATSQRQITNLAAGLAATDAVNVGQLRGTASTLGNSIATNFGGGAVYNSTTGAVTGPTYTIHGNTYNNVGSALTAVDVAVTAGGIPYLSADATAGTTAAVSSGAGSTTLGYGAAATGAGSTVIGNGALDNGVANATVIGNGASVGAGLSGSNVALGRGSLASTGGLTGYGAFGLVAPQNSAGEVSVGSAASQRQITNLAAGLAATDAVNVGQLRGTASTLGNSIATNFGGGAVYNSTTGAVTGPTYTIHGNTYNTVGSALTAVDNSITAGGIPYLSADANAGTTAAVSSGAGSTTLGYGAAATGAGSTVVGNGALDNGVANATVIGNGASVGAGLSGSNVALGRGSLASTGGLTGYGAFGLVAPQNSSGEVSVGSATSQRQITNLAAGLAATDAVNVGQLRGSASNLGTSIANNFGSGATYNTATGTVTAPRYTIHGNTYDNVGSALTAVDNSVTAGGIPYLAADANAGTAGAMATGTGATVLGYGAAAGGTSSTVVGNGALDNGVAKSTVLGAGATITAGLTGSNIALGQGSQAVTGGLTGYNAFGTTAAQNSAGEVSVGTASSQRQITNVAAGLASTDAVNVGQLRGTASTLGTSIATNLGGGTTYNTTTGAITSPNYVIRGNKYTNVASALTALDDSIATGGIPYLSADATAGTTAAVSTGAGAMALGYGASALGAASTVVGNGALDNGVANSTVLGNGATIKVGLTGSNVALGQGSTASTGGLTGYSAFGIVSPQTSAGEVSVGTATSQRQITNVAAGLANTDAVNVAQLRGTAASINTTITTVLGGGSTYNSSTGAVSGPSYSIAGNSYTTVGGALNALSQTITTNSLYFAANSTLGGASATGTDTVAVGPLASAGGMASVSIGSGAVTTGKGSVALGSGSTDGGVDNVVSVGAVGAERRIVNVADGTVSADSTDAVNGAQLYALTTEFFSGSKGSSGAGSTSTTTTTGGTDASNPVTIHNLAPGLVDSDAATMAQLRSATANAVQYDTKDGVRTNMITLAGGSAGAVRIGNVADGVAAGDAVNLGQMQAASSATLGQANAYTDGQVSNLAALTKKEIRQARSDAAGGTALALAATGVRYDDRPGKLSISGATAYYHDQMGLAFGIGQTSEDGRFRFNASVSASPTMTNPDIGAVVGASVSLN